MPVDPTISLGIKPPVFSNALTDPQQFNQLLGTADAFQKMQARQAIGSLTQQAVDPGTGVLDTNKLVGSIAKNPQAAYSAPEAITTALAQAKAHLENNGVSAESWKKQNDAFASVLTPLLTKPDLSQNDIIDGIGRLAALPEADRPVTMAQLMQAAQQVNGMGGDPAKLRQYLTQLSLSHQQSERLHAQIFPQPQPLVTGGNVQYMAGSGVVPPHSVSPQIPITSTPGEKMAGTAAVVPDGQGGFVPSVIPNATRFDDTGRPIGAMPAPVPPQKGAAASPSAPSSGLPTVPGGIPGALPTAPSLGQGIGIEGKAKLSTELWGQASAAANNFKSRVYPLEQAIPKLEKLGTTGTGPSAEEVNSIKSFLQTTGIIGPNQTVADFDEAKKYLTQYASGQASTMGQGTDQKLATALTANPNTSISNLASTDLAKAALALERMRQAQIVAFKNTKQTAEKFADFSADWNNSADPRAYMLDLVPAKKRKEIVDSIPASDRKKFFDQAWGAMQSGLMQKEALGGSNASK